jgi:hypothetical protein
VAVGRRNVVTRTGIQLNVRSVAVGRGTVVFRGFALRFGQLAFQLGDAFLSVFRRHRLIVHSPGIE